MNIVLLGHYYSFGHTRQSSYRVAQSPTRLIILLSLSSRASTSRNIHGLAGTNTTAETKFESATMPSSETKQACRAVSDDSTDNSADRDLEQDIPLESSIVREGKDVQTHTSAELKEEEIKDVVPNGGYGWVNVGCVVLQNSVTWGT
jgi:hypothetical protein